MLFLFPHHKVKRITDVDPETLRKIGIKALILDIDNTLATHDDPIPAIGVFEWISAVHNAGLICILLSNNSNERVAKFADLLSLPFMANGKKPLPSSFSTAAQKLDVLPSETAVIGDQIFTDIAGGRLAGMHCIYVDPIEREKDFFFGLKEF